MEVREVRAHQPQSHLHVDTHTSTPASPFCSNCSSFRAQLKPSSSSSTAASSPGLEQHHFSPGPFSPGAVVMPPQATSMQCANSFNTALISEQCPFRSFLLSLLSRFSPYHALTDPQSIMKYHTFYV